MSPDNGGIVLDLSEGGLGFHTVVPVAKGGRMPIRFSTDTISGIEAVGELAWLDESGRMGGLRFVELPPGIRDVIREWAGEETSLAAVGAAAAQPSLEPLSHSPAVLEPDATVRRVPVEIFESETRTEGCLPKILETQIADPNISTEIASPELQTEMALPEPPAKIASAEVSASPETAIEIPMSPIGVSNSQEAAIEIPMSPLTDDLFLEEITEESTASTESRISKPVPVEAMAPAPTEGLHATPYVAPDYSLSMFPSEMVYQERAERAERPPIYVRHPIAAVGAIIVTASVIGAGVFGIVTAGGVGAKFLQWVHQAWSLMHNL